MMKVKRGRGEEKSIWTSKLRALQTFCKRVERSCVGT